MSSFDQPASSGIRDNHRRGTVGDFLRAELKAGADLDIVTAYFTVFAHDKLKAQLDNLGKIRLLFGEAAFIKTIDPEHKHGAAYVLRDDGLALASGLSGAFFAVPVRMQPYLKNQGRGRSTFYSRSEKAV